MPKHRIIFFADQYWEIHWLHNVIKAMNGQLFTNNKRTKQVAQKLDIPLASDISAFQILVTCVYHMPENYKYIMQFFRTNRITVILQHAWDSQINAIKNFWDQNISMFNLYFTGCTQDEQWLSNLHPPSKIFNPGMPKLDDLFKIAQPNYQVDHIYKELKTDKFFLADLPPAVIYGQKVEAAYMNLPHLSPFPIVFKMHPGGNYQIGQDYLKKSGKNIIFLDDEEDNLSKTYELMKASQGVISLESFMSIEASLLKKPVIFYAHDQLPSNYFKATDRKTYSIQRLSPAMSSTIYNPKFNKAQASIAKQYTFDGKNTQRVVNLLKALQTIEIEPQQDDAT